VPLKSSTSPRAYLAGSRLDSELQSSVPILKFKFVSRLARLGYLLSALSIKGKEIATTAELHDQFLTKKKVKLIRRQSIYLLPVAFSRNISDQEHVNHELLQLPS
jgi:hypothetical protein